MDHSSALSVPLGRLDSDSMRRMYALVAYKLIRTSRIFTRSQTPTAQNSCSRASDERCSQGRTMLFAQPWQATKAAARTELCYISLASLALSLWPTSTHISSLHKYVAAQKTLESPKNWSAGPDMLYLHVVPLSYTPTYFCLHLVQNLLQNLLLEHTITVCRLAN